MYFILFSGVSRTVINEALNRLNKRSDQKKTSVASDDSTAKTKGRVHRPKFTDHNSQTTVHRQQFTDDSSQTTVHRPQFTDHSSQTTVHRRQFTDHSSQATVHRQQFTDQSSHLKITEKTELCYQVGATVLFSFYIFNSLIG